MTRTGESEPIPAGARPYDERSVGDLHVRIDRHLCVGFGDCIDVAPTAFRLDAEEIAEFADPGDVPRDVLLRACDSCPVDALTVWDADGRQIVP